MEEQMPVLILPQNPLANLQKVDNDILKLQQAYTDRMEDFKESIQNLLQLIKIGVKRLSKSLAENEEKLLKPADMRWLTGMLKELVILERLHEGKSTQIVAHTTVETEADARRLLLEIAALDPTLCLEIEHERDRLLSSSQADPF